MIRAGDVELVVTGGMESMSNAPYALERARFGYRLGDGAAGRPDGARRPRLDLRRPAHGRAGLVRLARARHLARGPGRVGVRGRTQRAVAAADAGRFRDEIVPVGERRGRREPAPRHLAREARRAEAGVRPGGNDDGRQRAGRERRRLLRGRRERGVGAAARASSRSRRSSRRASVADEFAYLARTPAQAAGDRARAGRQDDRRRRAGRDQRGVRVGRVTTRPSCSAPTRSA